MTLRRKANPQVHITLIDNSRGVTRGPDGKLRIGSLVSLRASRPGVKTLPIEGVSKILYNLGAGANNWNPGYSSGEGEKSKESDHLKTCAFGEVNKSQRTWETKDPIDFQNVRSIWVQWENVGDDSIENYTVLTVGPQGASLFEGDVIFFREGPFEKEFQVINVSRYTGTGHLKLHSFKDQPDVESCIKIYVVALAGLPSLEDLPEISACPTYDLPEGEEVAWLINIDENAVAGKDELITPICSEENFAVGVRDNSPPEVMFLAESVSEGNHGTFLSGWGNQPIILRNNAPPQIMYMADDQPDGEHQDEIPGWGALTVHIHDNTPE